MLRYESLVIQMRSRKVTARLLISFLFCLSTCRYQFIFFFFSLNPRITPHLSADTNSKGSSTQLHIKCSLFMLPCFIVYNMYFHWQERLQHVVSSCCRGRFCDQTLTQRLHHSLTQQMDNSQSVNHESFKTVQGCRKVHLLPRLALHSLWNSSKS